MTHPFSLAGRTAVVTGSTRGLGLAIARTLGEAGAVVGINGRDPLTTKGTARELGEAGIGAHDLVFDVSDTDAALESIGEFRDGQGSIDIFVHNAGHGMRVPFLEHGFDDWQRTLDVHLSAGFRLSQEVARHMVEQSRGRIIFVSSIIASIGRENVPAYGAAKGGMNALVRVMATELGPRGITVNAIAPGYIVTALTKPLQDNPEFYSSIEEKTPAGRWGEPEDIGWAALYLASDAASYVNGHVLTVDGGLTISL